MSHANAVDVHQALSQNQLPLGELWQGLHRRIERFDPQLGAFTFRCQLKEPKSGWLAGLPISIKDQFQVLGQPCSFGAQAGDPSQETSPIIQTLLDQGATLLGRTSLPPYAMDFQTYNELRGFCHNPWRYGFTAGGSSGGGCAAVASGLSLVDMGTDLAGSLRIPASFCGVYSLVPTDGRLTNQGMQKPKGSTLGHFARPGPIARSVADLALIWQALSGEVWQPSQQRYRLAFWSQCERLVVDNEIHVAMASAKRAWQQAGHLCQVANPKGFSFAQSHRLYGRIMGHETSEHLPRAQRWAGYLAGKFTHLQQSHTLPHLLSGYRRSPRRYQQACEERQGLIERCLPFWQQQDAWVLPVTGTLAFPHRTADRVRGKQREYLQPLTINGQSVNYFDALTSLTCAVTTLGCPVVTLPVGLDYNGMPIGVQLVGRPHGEMALLQLAHELSQSVNIPPCPLLQQA